MLTKTPLEKLNLATALADAEKDAVLLTQGGVLTHVLMTYKDYRRIIEEGPTILEAFSTNNKYPGLADIPDDIFERDHHPVEASQTL